MKKLFISIVAIAISMSAVATNTAEARIKLIGSNATYAVNTLYLNEDDARNNKYEDGYDGESMMTQSNPFSVLIYAYVETTHPCERVETNNLDGLALSFKTNMLDSDYKLKFTNVSGRALKVFDRVEGKLIDVVENGEYAFSVDPSEVGQKEVNERFFIGNPDPSFCFKYNKLEIIGYQGKSLVIKGDAGEIDSQASLGVVYEKDLSAQPANTRLTVTLDGTDYLIDVNPTVTVVPAP